MTKSNFRISLWMLLGLVALAGAVGSRLILDRVKVEAAIADDTPGSEVRNGSQVPEAATKEVADGANVVVAPTRMSGSIPVFWDSTMQKLEEELQKSLIEGIASAGPEFRSLVEFQSASSSDIDSMDGAPTVVWIVDYRTDAAGERALDPSRVEVRVLKNLILQNGVHSCRVVASSLVSGGHDVQVRFKTNLHDWASTLANEEAAGNKRWIHESGFGLTHNSMLLSGIGWAELKTKTDASRPVEDRWITVASVLDSAYAAELQAALSQ